MRSPTGRVASNRESTSLTMPSGSVLVLGALRPRSEIDTEQALVEQPTKKRGHLFFFVEAALEKTE